MGESAPNARRRIEIKLTEEQKTLIERAAGVKRVGLSAFVRSAAEKAARAALCEDETKRDR